MLSVLVLFVYIAGAQMPSPSECGGVDWSRSEAARSYQTGSRRASWRTLWTSPEGRSNSGRARDVSRRWYVVGSGDGPPGTGRRAPAAVGALRASDAAPARRARTRNLKDMTTGVRTTSATRDDETRTDGDDAQPRWGLQNCDAWRWCMGSECPCIMTHNKTPPESDIADIWHVCK